MDGTRGSQDTFGSGWQRKIGIIIRIIIIIAIVAHARVAERRIERNWFIVGSYCVAAAAAATRTVASCATNVHWT